MCRVYKKWLNRERICRAKWPCVRVFWIRIMYSLYTTLPTIKGSWPYSMNLTDHAWNSLPKKTCPDMIRKGFAFLFWCFRILQFNSILNAGIVENNSLPNMCEKINCKLWCRWVGFSYCKYCLSDKVAFWGENVGSKCIGFAPPSKAWRNLSPPGYSSDEAAAQPPPTSSLTQVTQNHLSQTKWWAMNLGSDINLLLSNCQGADKGGR